MASTFHAAPLCLQQRSWGIAKKMAGLLELVRARRMKGLVEALTAIVPEYAPIPTFLRHAA